MTTIRFKGERILMVAERSPLDVVFNYRDATPTDLGLAYMSLDADQRRDCAKAAMSVNPGVGRPGGFDDDYGRAMEKERDQALAKLAEVTERAALAVAVAEAAIPVVEQKRKERAWLDGAFAAAVDKFRAAKREAVECTCGAGPDALGHNLLCALVRRSMQASTEATLLCTCGVNTLTVNPAAPPREHKPECALASREVHEVVSTSGPAAVPQERPIPMVLHCPRCSLQHIDTPNPKTGWTNPSHRSHQCARCSLIWRPAAVLTEGVESIMTEGTADTPRSDWKLPSVTLPDRYALGYTAGQKLMRDRAAEGAAAFAAWDVGTFIGSLRILEPGEEYEDT